MSTVVSIFTSTYVFAWSRYFPNTPLQYAPSFDGRIVLYPTTENLRDYLSWRQVDCECSAVCLRLHNEQKLIMLLLSRLGHINNLFNTCFWALVHAGATEEAANKRLEVTCII